VYVADSIQGKTAKAKREVIKTGKTQGDFIEVLDGLKNGDAVVEEGARSVNDGQEVTILTKK